MHAAVRRWKADVNGMEDAQRKLEDIFIPQLKRIDGFVAYYLVEGENGEAATVSVFRDREGAEESTRVARAFAEKELGDFIQAPPEILEGEVRVHATAGQEARATV